jgi:hypothetical protein
MLAQVLQLMRTADGEPYAITVFVNCLCTQALKPPPEFDRQDRQAEARCRFARADRNQLMLLAEAIASGLERRLLEIEIPESLKHENLFAFREGRRELRISLLVQHALIEGQTEEPAFLLLGPAARKDA